MSREQVPEGYKKTEVGVIPDDWVVVQLQQLIDPCRKVTYGIVVPGPHKADGIPMIRAQDYSRGWVGIEDLYRVSSEIDQAYKRSKVIDGDVLLTIVGSVGNIVKVPKTFHGANLTQQTARLGFNKDIASADFYLNVLRSEFGQKEIINFTKSGVQPSLNLSDVDKFCLPCPPLAEQESIASTLSDIDNLLASLDRLIAKKRDLKQATMQQLLTGKKRLPGFSKEKDYQQTEVGEIPKDWKIQKLSQVVEIIDGDRGRNYPSSSDFYSDENCLFLSAQNVTKDGFRFTECLFITADKDKSLGQGKLEEKDVILTTRGTVGNFAFYDETVPYENIRINSGMVIIRKKSSNVEHYFLYLILKSFVVQDQIQQSVFGSAQPQLTVKGISKFMIPLPLELSEQAAIAQVLTDMDTELTTLQTRRIKTQALKQAMMQELLTGKTRLITPTAQ